MFTVTSDVLSIAKPPSVATTMKEYSCCVSLSSSPAAVRISPEVELTTK